MLFVDDDNVITTQIRENFWLASYGSFRVIMMADCGYINATKLCLLMGKQFSDWKDNTSSLLLMNALEDELELSNLHDGNVAPINLDTVCKTILTDNRTEEDKLISGTYCHPLLIPHIACWCSPAFAFRISRVINFILIEDWKMKLARSQYAYVELLKRENATITNLRESLQHQQQQQLSSRAITLLRINDNSNCLPYYIINCKRRFMSASINKLRRRHPGCKIIFQHNKVPNALNMLRELKRDNIIKSKRNYCIPITTADNLYH